MDAHALLTSQGWRGTGHSLHPTTDTTGLRRPLLVSRKDNTLGVGKKAHRTSDMWWLNAFDSSLKGLDTSTQGMVVQTVTSGGLDMVKRGGSKFVGKGGLYASFVRGEGLTGTIEKQVDSNISSDIETDTKPERRKKSEREGKETKEERRKRKELKRAARRSVAVKESSTELEGDIKQSETKEERRERRRQKKLAKEAEKNYIEVSSRKAEKQKRKELKAKRKDKSKKS
ncbi:hypothetical protein GLAREA_10835 [Glarea lozoyensis ATCC 20868]|uniref:DNA-directed RNA polymerase II subunit RPB1 n=1 Tax=Glarea lozoyensis (strain ATCC 20868 / MF5171) TaxID=1116229 RepID=S3DDF8_GLAL2|nr:uncharacterized protein GLAREA_10835 [Glarea lozoyensis ATCC 20868]EPE35139.1 hypothetical protein GLAREA_10835 [Glarea lozoyensis ATCC 20868]